MLSRVAESIYWMNRYVERAENVARFVHVSLNLQLEQLGPAGGNQWQSLVWTTGDEKQFEERYDKQFTRENVIEFLTFDAENPNSILSCVKWARENARSVREVISSEMWFTLNRFYLMMQDPQARQRAAADPHTFYTDVKTASALFVGEQMGTMSHGEGWHFGRIGRLIERADKTSRILDVKYFILLPKAEYVGMPIDTIQWASVLRSASAFEMFRKKFHAITPLYVAQFLLLDREFPRAVLFCLGKAEESLRAITGSAEDTFSNAAEQRLGRIVADLQYAQIDEIIGGGLHEYIDSLQTRLNGVGEAIYHKFFEIKQDVEASGMMQSQGSGGQVQRM
jgi:uncharacterized alpha-E superfamily protein